jgi:regulator of protease activity HflC (stomatin/prohibitin superfamily)
MAGSRGPLLAIGAFALVFLVWRSLFQVSETELAIRTAFGRIVTSDYEPGLHMKWPWEDVHRFEKRIITYPYKGETFLTSENKALIVDFYVKWRVKDPARYFTTTRGIESDAASRRTASRAWSRAARCRRSWSPSGPRLPATCSAVPAPRCRNWVSS